MCKVYTGCCGTSEIEHGLCACTVDNPLAKARGLSLRTGAQTMLYLSLVPSLNNPKGLDPSPKTDLDFCDVLEGKKLRLIIEEIKLLLDMFHFVRLGLLRNWAKKKMVNLVSLKVHAFYLNRGNTIETSLL